MNTTATVVLTSPDEYFVACIGNIPELVKTNNLNRTIKFIVFLITHLDEKLKDSHTLEKVDYILCTIIAVHVQVQVALYSALATTFFTE